jgi:hypothetical protein
MSDLARFWSRNLKGLNMAEHAICRELAEYHVEETNLCYPNMNTLCSIYECSRDYLKKVLNRLDTWRLLEREEAFDPTEANRQTSNRYRLNLRRHCPDPAPDGRKTKDKNPDQTPRPYDKRDFQAITSAQQGRRILKAMHHFAIDQGLDDTIPQCITEAYLLEKVLWVWAENEYANNKLIESLPDLSSHARKHTSLEFEIRPIKLYFKNKKR